MLKSRDTRRKKRRISKALRDALVSGEEWRETTEILRALEPARVLLRAQIEALEDVLDSFIETSGKVRQVRLEDGSTQISVSLNDATWTSMYDPDGRRVQMVVDDRTMDGPDGQTIDRLSVITKAAEDMPRRKWALEELERIMFHIEAANATSGLERLRDLFKDDPSIVYNAISMAETEQTPTDEDDFLGEVLGE